MTRLAARPATRIPPTDPDRAVEVKDAEARAFLDLLGDLSPQEWARPTDCEGWTVRDIAAHVTGAAEEALRRRVLARHLVQAQRRPAGSSQLDAINQRQIDDRRTRSDHAIVEELAAIAGPAFRRQRRTLLRRVRLPASDPHLPGAPLAYLFDVIAVRDLWMHRVDVARATGRDRVHGDHEREIVAQVVRDLGSVWRGPPVLLELTGPAGGCWTLGAGNRAARVTADTVAYLRALSGRDDAVAVAFDDPDAAAAARAARVVF